MNEYTKRLTAPTISNRYYYENNIFYNSGYGMPNCTAYAWGRFYELTNERPKLSTSNAELWYNYNDGYERGTTPKLGAIAVWSKGQIGTGNDGGGHVGIVEEIYEDGSILTSNSAYNSTNFYTQVIKNDYRLTGYNFLGFIYNPIDFTKTVSLDKTKSLQLELNKYNSNLIVDGIIGPKTEAAIRRNYNKFYIVRWVQDNLNDLGYNCGSVDGIRGPNTINGIKSFQQVNSLRIDGIAGVDTIKTICTK